MPKPPNPKCELCWQLPAAVAQQVHGTAGDNCWEKRCHRRRCDYRRRAEALAGSGELSIAPPDVYFAVLYLYKLPGNKIHAASAALMKGQEVVQQVKPIHCFGYTEGQIRRWAEEVLVQLRHVCQQPLGQYKEIFNLKLKGCPVESCGLNAEDLDL